MKCFNSSVVRLKVKTMEVIRDEEMKFQFQCGSIERYKVGDKFESHFMFQFQCGSIESSGERHLVARIFLVSIPVGFD